MEYLKNIEAGIPARLEDLISIRDGQIVSMALSRVDNVQLTLFALSAGETISEEAYPGDTLYHVLSGGITIRLSGNDHPVAAGDVLAAPGGVLHALTVDLDTKLLQITIEK